MRTSRSVPSIWFPIVGLLAAAFWPLSPERAAAAVINVDTLEEVNPALCTVRNAIVSANTNANFGGCNGVGTYGADTVVLARGIYTLTQPHAGEDGLPIITDSLTIEGNGSTIERTLGASPSFFRIIHHMGGRLELRNLTIKGGRIEGPLARGGGILSEPGVQAPATATRGGDDFDPDLVLTGVLLILNIVVLLDTLLDVSADGGGLFVAILDVLITASEFFGNEVNADAGSTVNVLTRGLENPAGIACGGAIAALNSPRVDIVSTRVHGNRARARGNLGSAAGGGVCHLNNAPSEVNYLASVIDGNETDAGTGAPDPAGTAGSSGGGGFAAFGHAPEFDIRFTEIRGNTALANAGPGKAGIASGGGGLAFFGATCGSMRVRGSTFANNSAIADGAKGGAGVGAFGGGLAAFLPDGVNLDVTDSSVTNNLARSDAPNGVAAGGGIEMSFPSSSGSANLNTSNTTFGHNRAEAPAEAGVAAGGGARMARRGDFTLSSSTASGNSASGTSLGGGGGAFVQSNAVFKPINSMLSGNTVASPTLASGPDCGRSGSGTVASLGHNLFGVADLCAAIASDLVGVPAGLGAFTEGSRVRSGHFPLLPDSPTLDAGDVAACPPRDQLGQKRAGPCDLGAVEQVPFTPLVFSGLPNGRAGAPGDLLSLFVTAINAGPNEAYRVGIDSLLPLVQSAAAAPRALVNPLPLTFTYRTTDAANQLTGTPNTPVDILPGAAQNYILFIRPTDVFGPVDLALGVAAPNGVPLPPIRGVSTVVVSSAEPRPPDVVALAATVGNNGIMDLAPLAFTTAALGSGFFSVAVINLGAGGPITATVDTGGVSLPLNLVLCQTNPITSVCISPLQPSLTVTINTNETPTFAVFGTSTDPIAFDPAANRAFVSFKDAGGLVRGGTSVAVRTVP